MTMQRHEHDSNAAQAGTQYSRGLCDMKDIRAQPVRQAFHGLHGGASRWSLTRIVVLVLLALLSVWITVVVIGGAASALESVLTR